MRIGLGAILLFQAYILWAYRELLLNATGPVPWELSDSWLDPLLPKLSHLVPPFDALGLGPEAVVAFVLGIHAIAAAFLMVGYRTRASAVFAWATFVMLKDSSPAFMYGVGSMLLIALFYSLFMPVGREWSLDRVLRLTPVAEGGDASFSVMVLRLHMCIIYGVSAIAKAAGEQWWSGEALWRSLSHPQYGTIDPSFLVPYPLVLQAMAIFTILAQLSYPVLVWTRARVWIVAVTELLHLGIAIFLGLWLFSAMMIVLNAAAFGEAVWKAFVARFGTRPTAPSAGGAP